MTTANSFDEVMGMIPDWALLLAVAAIVLAGVACRLRERKGRRSRK